MKVLIDTNIVLDVLLNRMPFVDKSRRIFEAAESGMIEAYLTSNSVTDIVYILRKAYRLEEIRTSLLTMFGFIRILNVGASDILNALKSNIPDFEDAVIMQCARHADMDFIVSRNKADFINTSVPCLSVEEWVQLISTENRTQS